MAPRLGAPCFGRVNVDVFIRDTAEEGSSGELFLGAVSLSLESAESFAFVPSPSEVISQYIRTHLKSLGNEKNLGLSIFQPIIMSKMRCMI